MCQISLTVMTCGTYVGLEDMDPTRHNVTGNITVAMSLNLNPNGQRIDSRLFRVGGRQHLTCAHTALSRKSPDGKPVPSYSFGRV